MFDRSDVLGWHATQECPGTPCVTDTHTVQQATDCLQSKSADFCWLQLWGLADLHEDRYTHLYLSCASIHGARHVTANHNTSLVFACLLQLAASVPGCLLAHIARGMLLYTTTAGQLVACHMHVTLSQR